MSLLDPVDPAHAPALKRFAARLRTGTAEERAVLLNLQEEDRVPHKKRAAFQAALARSKRRAWRDRFGDASVRAQRALSVPSPCPAAVGGDWWNHIPLEKLQRFNYVTRAITVRTSAPPPRLALKRPIGRPEKGLDLVFWITNATSSNADDIRDRLGLSAIGRGVELYRVRIGVDPAAGRPLYIPTALDAGFYPAWRRPDAGHVDHWGLTRHLSTDAPSERELLALPDAGADALEAHYVGPVTTDPPRDYLAARGIP